MLPLPKQWLKQCIHVASRKYPAAVRPDFTCFVADGDVDATGYATPLTDIVEGNILKDINNVPIAGSQYDATDSNNRGMVWEGILNVGMAQINANDTMTADDLFSDASPAGIESDEMQGFPHLLQSQMQAAVRIRRLTTTLVTTVLERLTLNHSWMTRTSSVAPKSRRASMHLMKTPAQLRLNDGIAGAGAIDQHLGYRQNRLILVADY